jgi:hypothetical protein
MPKSTFFATPKMMQALNDASIILTTHQKDELRYRLGSMLQLISKSALEFDEHCRFNIESIGEHVLGEVQEVIGNQNDANVQSLSATIYRFISEYNFSFTGELKKNVRDFMRTVEVESEKFTGPDREQIEYVKQQMPIAIFKSIITSDEIGNLRNVSDVAARVEKTIQGWQGTIEKAEQTAVKLKEALEKHTKEFNFVGLHEGFADLAIKAENELKIARKYMVAFGGLALFPSALDIWLTMSGRIDLAKLNNYALVLVGVATVSMTALILYYFRIALRKADSCTAQLTQIRLRMSLCRFIQSYADYSKEIKEKNADALSKFEALIFSGIVSSEDKLPSTFDGIEQLSVLAKSIAGK